MIRYLVSCLVAGLVIGRAFGAFARARFHYPLRREDVPTAHRALLDALDVVEWPSLFVLTLLASLLLWRVMRPATRTRAATGSRGVFAATFAACLAGGLVVVLPATGADGRLLAGVWAGALAATIATLVRRSWVDATASSGSRRFTAQLPVPAGHLAAGAAASLSLGYRGESALVHGVALLVTLALFAAELALALVVAVSAAAARRRAFSSRAA